MKPRSEGRELGIRSDTTHTAIVVFVFFVSLEEGGGGGIGARASSDEEYASVAMPGTQGRGVPNKASKAVRQAGGGGGPLVGNQSYIYIYINHKCMMCPIPTCTISITIMLACSHVMPLF